MQLQKPDRSTLSLWRFRLIVAGFLLAIGSIYFSRVQGILWVLFTLTWIVAFLYMYIFYYPIKYKKLSYVISQGNFIVNCGVIYTRIKAMPVSSVQYVSVSTTPLQAIYGLRTVIVFTAGSVVHISGVTPENAAALQEELTGTEVLP